ncbi:MAG: TrmH family RNA methyltransferase [Acidimicrobiia bacterium]
MDITSAANPRIRRLLALRDRKERDRESVFLVEGSRDLGRAVSRGHRPLEIYYDPARFSSPPHRAGTEVSVAAEALDRASYRGKSQGVIGVFGQFDVTLDHLTPGPDPLFLIAEAIEKPGNLGAMLRTADAVGADALIAADPDADPFSPNVVRASTGAIFSVPLGIAHLEAAVAWVRVQGARVVAAHPDAPLLLWETDLTGPVALLVGSEDTGLSDSALNAADVTVSLPMRGSTDSLNVSVSLAVLAYETLRQRSAQ